ncbi:MAG: hypothetical protein HKN47_28930 [Pirellulaceae bacterium]|nr:hypothetical protein [Pirellulaceae bacterium]
MAIQLDIRRLIQERVEAISRDDTRIYITDKDGVIEMVYDRGRFVQKDVGTPVADVVKELSILFLPAALESSFSDGKSIYAIRLRLGQGSAQTDAEIGIVVQVAK